MLNGKELSLMNHEGYKAAWNRLMELREQRDELEKKAEELRRGRPETVKTQNEKRVDAILRGEEPESVKGTEQWLTDLSEAQSRARLFSEAARKQEGEVQKQRLIASKEICKTMAPKYRDLIKRLGLAYVELLKLSAAEKDMRESLNDGDIAYSSYIRPMPINHPGDPRDTNSRAGIWLVEAIQYDFITLADIPLEWRPRYEERLKVKKSADQPSKTSQTKKAEPVAEGWNA
jgi:hypothetical protein